MVAPAQCAAGAGHRMRLITRRRAAAPRCVPPMRARAGAGARAPSCTVPGAYRKRDKHPGATRATARVWPRRVPELFRNTVVPGQARDHSRWPQKGTPIGGPILLNTPILYLNPISTLFQPYCDPYLKIKQKKSYIFQQKLRSKYNNSGCRNHAVVSASVSVPALYGSSFEMETSRF